ncbi:hypothetical protein CPB86DRAFT_788868 [Serendipita vermifera]|nr:hypothetical protein CPB86DRAFT_788868 [Serendipita vermifera]
MNYSHVRKRTALSKVLSLEPNNQTAKQELDKVTTLIESAKKASTPRSINVDKKTPQKPYRRRVPIEIVEDDVVEAKSTDTLQSSSKEESITPETTEAMQKIKPLIEEIRSPSVANSKPSPPSFQQAKQDRAQRTYKTVGGGFIKRDGTTPDAVFKPKTIIEVANTETIQTSPEPEENKEPIQSRLYNQPKPANAFEFQRQWQRFQNLDDRWAILQSISPESLPGFFKTSLESQLLASILSVLLHSLTNNLTAKDTVVNYLRNIARIPRFDSMILFFSASEKDTVRQLLNRTDSPVSWKV